MLSKEDKKIYGNGFRDYYKKRTILEKDKRLHEYDNDRIIRLFIKKLKDKIINTPSGVHINRIGYFYVHMIPFNIKWYTIKKIKKYHPTFIPTEASIFKFWTMDFHFSRNLINEIQKRVKDGYRYLNMIKGISRTDYYYLGVNKYSWRQHKKIKKINNEI